jgi:selenocysteine-specific elongation factor
MHREDEFEVFPTRRRVRIRGIQVHGEVVENAVAGQRTALNLAGAAVDDLGRGMTLASAATLVTTRRADVRLRLLDSVPRPLKTRIRVHFHCNTMESVAAVRLYGPELRPGNEAYARITLSEPVLLLPGDHFIIRQFSPVVTIGGGVVLDAAPLKRSAHLRSLLRLLARDNPVEILRIRVARRRSSGITIPALVAETGWSRERIEGLLAPLLQSKTVLRIADLLVHSVAANALRDAMGGHVERFQQQNPLVTGINREHLREQSRVPDEIFNSVLDLLVAAGKLEITGDLVRVPGRSVVMKDEEAESKKKIEDAFATVGLTVPALAEVLAGLKIDKARAQKIVTLLLRDKILTKVSAELVFHRSALEDLRRRIGAYKLKSTRIDVAKFKELTGVSRKYAIPLLEYLDRERVTKRVGDAREIL